MPFQSEAKQAYSEDNLPEFTPMPWSLSDIRAAIPAHLHVRKTWKGLLYLARDLVLAAFAWQIALYIDPTFRSSYITHNLTPHIAEVLRWGAWLVYWWFQGLIFTGIWVIGHECGHGAFSASKRVCDVVGYITHTLLWTPYFSWQISHHRHHSNHASMERDEVYVPKTRSDLGIPNENEVEFDYEDYFGDTPIYTLLMLIRQQLLAFPAYLFFNVSGQKNYPKWTNHFDPKSVLFTRRQRDAVILSNIGIASMVWAVTEATRMWGVVRTSPSGLHHTDIELPHYRNGQWNFQRGAAATVDRNFLGWQGRFFLHDVAHFHVIHHFFPHERLVDNGAEATQHLKAFIGDHYRYSDKPAFRALWETSALQGDILFYRDRKGQARVRPANQFRVQSSGSSLALRNSF